MKLSRAFTVIELIFVIVVLGILSAIALPKFANTGTQARVTSGKADVSAIRSAIMSERQKGIIKGQSSFIGVGTGTDGDGNKELDNGGLFGGVLTYAKQDSTGVGQWHKTGSTGTTSTYTFNVDGATTVSFTYYEVATTVGATTYNAGTFTCNPAAAGDAGKYCKQMIY
ncbi:type II secretion system protein [Sulfurimonas sp.]|uniref:type II secretion system protein n=1 Tax=Sulfurimonas sp. TaxID=2022749 RepID=UPI003D1395BB